MWEFLKNIKSLLSLDNRQIFIVAGISWVLIAIPIAVRQMFGLITISNQSRPLVFIVALTATLWLIIGGIYDLINVAKLELTKRAEPRRMKRTREEVMLSTSRVEREVLAKYIEEDTTTLSFDIRDGVANGLMKKAILYQASTLSNPFSSSFDTNIHPWALKYLKSHREILEGIEPRGIGRHQIRF